MSDLVTIRDDAYKAYIRDAKSSGTTSMDTIVDASEAGLQAVWDASIAARPNAAMTPVSDIHMSAYSAHIRNTSHVGPTDERLARDANEAGLKAVWDAAAAATRDEPAALPADATDLTPGAGWEPCGRGVCMSFDGHVGTCDQASYWHEVPSKPSRR